MSKLKLEFDMFEDRHDVSVYIAAPKMYEVLREIDEELRSLTKYDNNRVMGHIIPDINESTYELCDAIRSAIWNVLGGIDEC